MARVCRKIGRQIYCKEIRRLVARGRNSRTKRSISIENRYLEEKKDLDEKLDGLASPDGVNAPRLVDHMAGSGHHDFLCTAASTRELRIASTKTC